MKKSINEKEQCVQTDVSKSVFVIPYEDLEKHFTSPKVISPFFKNVNRVPRKFKKKWKHILCGNRYEFLDLGQKLWHIQSLTNPNYNRFLIKQIVS